MNLFAIVLIAIIQNPVYASSKTYNRDFQEFYLNPKVYLQKIPTKSSSQPTSTPAFTQSEIRDKSFLDKKDSIRRHLCFDQSGQRHCPQLNPMGSFFTKRDRSSLLEPMDESTFRAVKLFFEFGTNSSNLKDLASFQNQEIAQSPWSDTYWPLYKGTLGQRYADTNFPSGDWLTNYNYVSKFDIFSPGPKDHLSPSEKYDFIMGDQQKVLTDNMWNQGRYYFERSGEVEKWMGLCHGWAAASYMLPRPKHSINVLAADGITTVKLYPTDIKALATLLWAGANTNTLFVGGRCNDKNPPVDESGRVTSRECFDTNPGAWHLMMIHRIKNNKPFIFDASYDYEVWNQPVLGYSLKYINPETLEEDLDLDKAVIPMNSFVRDPFKKYRSTRSQFVVAVAMDVNYLAETQPSTREEDFPDFDRRVTVRYLYDLELDSRWNIIGGEWYQNAHPDFAWTPESNARALSPGDRYIQTDWKQGAPAPKEWLQSVQQSSSESLPLANVVERFVQWSQ